MRPYLSLSLTQVYIEKYGQNEAQKFGISTDVMTAKR